jgi:hypothetical protein
MLLGRYGIALPTLALAGSLARKHTVHTSEGALPTHTPLFGFWLLLVVLCVGAMSFLPALALGPIAEHLISAGYRTQSIAPLFDTVFMSRAVDLELQSSTSPLHGVDL